MVHQLSDVDVTPVEIFLGQSVQTCSDKSVLLAPGRKLVFHRAFKTPWVRVVKRVQQVVPTVITLVYKIHPCQPTSSLVKHIKSLL